MKSQTRKTLKTLVPLVAVGIALATPLASPASNIARSSSDSVSNLPPVQITTEALMNAEGADAGLIGMFFGADSGSPLHFTSFVDPKTFTFSFSLNPGSTYLGQSITESASGSFDPNTGILSATTSGTLGATTFSITDLETFTDILNGIEGSGDQTFSLDGHSIPGHENERRHVERVREFRDGTSEESGYYEDKEGHRTPFTEPDRRRPDEPDWDFGTRHGGPYSTGFSPLDGGAGSFTTTVSPVPEPSTLLLIGSGILGLGGFLRKRLLTRG